MSAAEYRDATRRALVEARDELDRAVALLDDGDLDALGVAADAGDRVRRTVVGDGERWDQHERWERDEAADRDDADAVEP